MGAVYVAEQLSTGRLRALKVMKAGLVADKKSRRRFLDEARVGARIKSEHVVEVVEAGFDEDHGVPWLAMELLDGQDLGLHVEEHGPLPLDEVASLFEQAAHALGRAHALGIVHRDLKPENLFVARSSRVGGAPLLKVLDFGIAAFVATDKTSATVTTALSTPLWAAPEQLSPGKKVRPATDVFALGLIAFYLLTGKSYWRSPNAEEFDLHALVGEIVALPLERASVRAAEFGMTVPDGFDAWFARCVVRAPSARFATATEAAQALSALAIGTAATLRGGVAKTLPPASPPTNGTEHRWRWLVPLFALAVVSAGAAVVWFDSCLPPPPELPDGGLPEPLVDSGYDPRLDAGPRVDAGIDAGRGRHRDAGVGASDDAGRHRRRDAGRRQRDAGFDAGREFVITVTGEPMIISRCPQSHISDTEPPPTGMGVLRVQTVPYSMVSVDGRQLGNTPQTRIELPAGRHRVRLTNVEFNFDYLLDVEIRASLYHRLIHRMSPALRTTGQAVYRDCE